MPSSLITGSGRLIDVCVPMCICKIPRESETNSTPVTIPNHPRARTSHLPLTSRPMVALHVLCLSDCPTLHSLWFGVVFWLGYDGCWPVASCQPSMAHHRLLGFRNKNLTKKRVFYSFTLWFKLDKFCCCSVLSFLSWYSSKIILLTMFPRQNYMYANTNALVKCLL